MSLGQLDLLAIPFARVGRAARGEYQTISISMFGFFLIIARISHEICNCPP